ncbi:MAG TPA: aromatic ring-hydroxylating dioxygenase subunit alpha [Candidatus Acidoferrales bacterium]|nr:aromatic ring-hydroxylating dioxygenase subunit alpha [Candidatus Acidoferrales bacterium]
MLRSLSREAYWGEAFFERERRAIFWSEWFYAGRADALDAAGAYCVLEVAGESVVVVRGEDGIYAHRNFCRHRGSRLLCGEGRVRGAIRCPYHAWAYALDGRLIASPFVEPAEVPPDSRRLVPVAAATWGGFLFVRLRPPQADAKSLHDSLGPVPARLARYPLADLRTAHSIRYEVAANWKVLLENYNECYHCAGVHPELCRVVPAFKSHGGSELDWEAGIPHREGAWTFTFSGTTQRAPFATLDDDERVRHKGELVYPNMMLSLSADHVAAFSVWPVAPAKTLVVCDFLFDPQEMARPGFDPSDAVDFWDLVNRQDWAICESVQAGMHSEAFDRGYYAPMEDYSLDIRRYIADKVGEDAVAD